MVTRKPSFPKLNSPFSATDGSVVDSADLPPIPHPPRDDSTLRAATSFLDNENPWKDPPSSQLLPLQPVSASVQPRNGKLEEGTTEKQPLHFTPAALNPGPSGRDTPRSSVDSGESRDFWEDDEVPASATPAKTDGRGFVEHSHGHSQGLGHATDNGSYSDNEWTHIDAPPIPTQLPPPPPTSTGGIKRKPVTADLYAQPPQPQLNSHSTDFPSLNPFRRPSPAAVQQEELALQTSSYFGHTGRPEDSVPIGKGKQPVRDPVHTNVPVTEMSNMYLSYRQPAEQSIEDPWRPVEPTTLPPPPPTVPSEKASPSPAQLMDQKDQLLDPWASSTQPLPSPSSFDQSQKHYTQYTDGMLDRGHETGLVSLSDELQSLANANAGARKKATEQSLLDDDDGITPLLPDRSANQHTETDSGACKLPDGPPPSRGLSSATTTVPLSEAEIAKNIEDRSETYQIKHFNWFDHSSGRLRSSSILVQNKNGPCPLLALVNALILGAKEESQASLDDALRAREQVSIGLIIESLMYELVTRGAESGAELPDVDALNAFLMRLKTGMNANPRFVADNPSPPNLMDAQDPSPSVSQAEEQKQKAGSFESTPDMNLYRAFAVPLLHGWLPTPGTPAEQAYKRSAQTYEDAQALQFNEEELEYKLTTSGLSPQEQSIWQDINAIKAFLQRYPTQLTPYGLEAVRESLAPGSFAIMFRNDHFSTIYKHPLSGQLFTLITDAGYAEREEVIWESLVDISGADNDYFSGDFRFVSHDQVHSRNASDAGVAANSGQHLSVPEVALPLSRQEQQEQHDADFAMALQLQEEEEQRERAANARRGRPGPQPTTTTTTSSQNRQSRRGSTSIPVTLNSVSSVSDTTPNRPGLPPRFGRGRPEPGPSPGPPAVNRPSDALEDDAPPAYEEAAKGKPYIPPVGSPLHPTWSSEPGASANTSSTQVTGTVGNINSSSNLSSAHPPGPNAPYVSGSGYLDSNSNNNGRMPGQWQSGSSAELYGSRPSRVRLSEDRDCIVM